MWTTCLGGERHAVCRCAGLELRLGALRRNGVVHDVWLESVGLGLALAVGRFEARQGCAQSLLERWLGWPSRVGQGLLAVASAQVMGDEDAFVARTEEPGVDRARNADVAVHAAGTKLDLELAGLRVITDGRQGR